MENDLVQDSMTKLKEFGSIAKSTLGSQDWGTWASSSRPIAAWTSLGLSIVTLFLFGHLFSCIYAFIVGLFIGMLDIELIYNSIPGISIIRNPLLANGIDTLAGKGCTMIFSSIGFFTGTFSPLYIAGIVILLSGVTHLLEIFMSKGGSEADGLTDVNNYSTFQS